MKDELKRIWKEATDNGMECIWKEGFVLLLKYDHSVFSEGETSGNHEEHQSR
jgi:hypothetical protein